MPPFPTFDLHCIYYRYQIYPRPHWIYYRSLSFITVNNTSSHYHRLGGLKNSFCTAACPQVMGRCGVWGCGVWGLRSRKEGVKRESSLQSFPPLRSTPFHVISCPPPSPFSPIRVLTVVSQEGASLPIAHPVQPGGPPPLLFLLVPSSHHRHYLSSSSLP
jgi:hypothetical protein